MRLTGSNRGNPSNWAARFICIVLRSVGWKKGITGDSAENKWPDLAGIRSPFLYNLGHMFGKNWVIFQA